MNLDQNEQHDPEQQHRFVWLLLVRVLVTVSLLGSTVFFNIRSGQSGFSITQILLYSVVVLVFVLTLFYAIWLRHPRQYLSVHIQVQILFDVMVATLLVYITGGVESPFTFFYALPIIQTAVFFPRRGAMLTAGLSSLFLAALLILEYQSLLPVNLEGRVQLPPTGLKVVYLLAFNFAVFFAIAWLSGSLGEQLRKTGRELKQTEEEVEALVALNRDIVISLRSGLMVMDSAGVVSLVNPMAEIIIGARAAEVIGRPGWEVLPSLAAPLRLPPEEISLDDELNRLETDHQRSDGVLVPIGCTLSPLTQPDGVKAGTLIHMQDLTSIKAMEKSMKKSERMAALGEMAALIAHEIRNPLASISGSAQMLKGSAELAEVDQRLMTIIYREAQRLNVLITDFLSYSRPKPPQMKSIDIGNLISEMIEVFYQQPNGSQGKQIDFEYHQAVVSVDSSQLRQVMWNLLTNADQAAEERIEVRIAPRNRTMCIEVWNDGQSIDESLHEKYLSHFLRPKRKARAWA